jgi:hypothetical protein
MRFTTARGALVALLAVVIVSVVGAVPASASTQCELNKQAGSEEYTLCIEGKQIGSPTQPALSFASESKSSNLIFTGPEGAGKLVCSQSNLPGYFRAGAEKGIEEDKPLELLIGEKGKEDILKGCKLEGSWAKKCKVPSEILPPGDWFGQFAKSVGTLSMSGAADLLLLILFENNSNETCPFKGEKGVYGHFQCKVSEAEVEKIERDLSCASTGREVEWEAEIPATLQYTQVISLAGEEKGKKFSFFEST